MVISRLLFGVTNLGIKTIIHEQNSSGVYLINYYLTSLIRFVSLLKESEAYFPRRKLFILEILEVKEILSMEKGKKTLVLIIRVNLLFSVMGSLGSLTMTKKNERVNSFFKDKDYQVLVVTGKKIIMMIIKMLRHPLMLK